MLQVAKIFKLKALEELIEKDFIARSWHSRIVDEEKIKMLNIAHKYKFTSFMNLQMEMGDGLENYHLLKSSGFKELHREIQFEIIKNKIHREFLEGVCQGELMLDIEFLELKFIFNFLDLLVYENRTVGLAAKKSDLTAVPSKLKTPIEELIDLDAISCSRDSKFCVTLVVENIEIHVNSALLTNNSPVFKAMLNSTFKEGQDKRIVLPGKKFTEFVYFLQYLHSPKVFGNIHCEYTFQL